MYPIYILEDDVIQQNRLKEAIDRYAVSKQWGDYQCKVFDDGQELLTAFEKSGEKALFFLDLEIKGVKRLGLEVAKVIYKTSPFSLIVFVSTHSEYMPHTYKSMVRAMDFIIKGFNTAMQFTIITSAPESIIARIHRELDRGCTQISARGTYSGQPIGTLLCVVSRLEAARLKKIVAEVDPCAFVTVCDVHEALGEGFTGIREE